MALAISDTVRAAAEHRAARGGEMPSALVAVGHAPGLSNDQLAQVLGLSHPGTVRAVDRLVADGLMARRPGEQDRRAVALHLTPLGWARRRAILADRGRALDAAMAGLSAVELVQLEGLLAKLLGGLTRDALQGLSICRLCDEASCTDCPVDAALARSCE